MVEYGDPDSVRQPFDPWFTIACKATPRWHTHLRLTPFVRKPSGGRWVTYMIIHSDNDEDIFINDLRQSTIMQHSQELLDPPVFVGQIAFVVDVLSAPAPSV